MLIVLTLEIGIPFCSDASACDDSVRRKSAAWFDLFLLHGVGGNVGVGMLL